MTKVIAPLDCGSFIKMLVANLASPVAQNYSQEQILGRDFAQRQPDHDISHVQHLLAPKRRHCRIDSCLDVFRFQFGDLVTTLDYSPRH